jgi:hypothetical protein
MLQTLECIHLWSPTHNLSPVISVTSQVSPVLYRAVLLQYTYSITTTTDLCWATLSQRMALYCTVLLLQLQ